MLIEIEDIKVYEQLKNDLLEIYPQVKIELLHVDKALFDLKISSTIPCTINIDATEEQIEEIMDRVMKFETDAFNTPDGSLPSDDNPDYLLYKKYGWIWSFFYRYLEAE